jgi:hypothetical protein
VLELDTAPEWRKVDVTTDVPAWVAESHELAKTFVYCPEIITAAGAPRPLAAVTLPEAYLKEAGAKARQRVGAAGMRLAAVLAARPDVGVAASLR